ncbi:hypothetical protein EI94DRAFT_954150 [Lactarius quietus]|nr:hypothetical protein EI94DRAFT_954150 [Lactarius quietus]
MQRVPTFIPLPLPLIIPLAIPRGFEYPCHSLSPSGASAQVTAYSMTVPVISLIISPLLSHKFARCRRYLDISAQAIRFAEMLSKRATGVSLSYSHNSANQYNHDCHHRGRQRQLPARPTTLSPKQLVQISYANVPLSMGIEGLDMKPRRIE